MVATEVRFAVLGPLRAEVRGRAEPFAVRSGQPTRLALFLLHARGEFVPVARLIDRLWDGAPPRGASSTLHSHARALRSALAGAGAGGADLLVSERGRGYRLRLSAAGPGGAATDEDEFRALLDVGDRAVAAGDEDASIDSYRAALALWRGDEPYPELSADLDVEPHRAELVGLRDRGMRRLGDLLLASGRLDTAIPLFEAERAQRPTDQAVTARLMRAYAAAGDPQRATALYAELVRLLRDEHDDRPVRELAELDGRILRGDPTVVGLAEPRSLDRPASARALAVRSATVQDGAPRLARRTVSLGGALAAELTALVGRQREIDDAVAALGPGRLVTLYGPAGAGKSRLAREVARRLAGSGTEVRRAQLVDCDPDDLAGVLERVAEAFGVTAAVESSLVRAVAERVGGVDSLLVIDNCETVLERVALLTMRLLESCPTLSVVVTSREALHLPGERAVVIEPLPVDVEIARALALGAGADVLVRPRTAAVGELSPAGQLLAQRCLDAGWLPAGGAGSRLGAEERFDLEAIAALVDGLPLALEVLAPLAASHPLADLVERLGRGAGSVPADGSRSGAAGPLADVLGWAFDRLDQLERTVLFAAASFQTSCTAAGLVAVVEGEAGELRSRTAEAGDGAAVDGAAVDGAAVDGAAADGTAVLAALDRLVARSLIAPVRGSARGRFRMLATVRAAARQRAVAAGRRERFGDAHARYVARLAAGGAGPTGALRVERDGRLAVPRALHPDDGRECREAVLWAIGRGDDDIALAILDSLSVVLYRLGLPPQVGAWLERLSTDDGGAERAAVAADLRSTRAFFSGDYEGIDRWSPVALDAVRSLDDPHRLCRALVISALSHIFAGRDEAANEAIGEAAAASAGLEDDWLDAWVAAAEGFLARRSGDFERSRRCCEAALETFVDLDDRLGMVLPTLTLGRLAERAGRPEDGLALIDQATAVAESVEDGLLAATGHLYAGQIHYGSGQPREAINRLISALYSGRISPHRIVMSSALEHLAGVLAAFGRASEAARIVGFTTAYRRSGPQAPAPRELGYLPGLRDALGERAFERQRRLGARLDLDAAIALAVGALGDLDELFG